MQAVLALEDGSIYRGRAIGAPGESWGEVVFNTGMTGYECVLTDPSYCGQIVVMTSPLIGNYGICDADFESNRAYVRGFVVRDACETPSNWRSEGTLDGFLKERGVVGLTGVDTRAITRRLRTNGTMRGIIATGDIAGTALVEQSRTLPHLSEQDFILEVTGSHIHTFPGPGPRIAVIDLGAKGNIARCLNARGCEVVVFPAGTDSSTIAACRPDGLVLSNGPGDPVKAAHVAETARQFFGKIPVMGICLGHQLLALALGARTYKLKFGHRGANHPVLDVARGRVIITSHNHGFSVDEESLKDAGLIVTFRSLNDGTVEGLKHPDLPIVGTQFHPEAAPGPKDANYLFDEYIALLKQETEETCLATAI
ncbi:MAG: glutamine-hydrolyzing carbamoyl-phosphate synthase small subunit [Firmicutes bacterium]|nr:glutamine-hydrolyzing carbamoyl-phosphate synthase small subunit [Bacillota bacterium]